ncbi:MAG: AAA family ATPase [Actinomycetales bacterium]|nr:AAA family ATPase [Actinomycetales bacterium]
MRLHRLHLRDVKGVTDRTIEFPDSGVVVIEGPNEIGKTTLLEAFDLLLDPRAKASSQSKAVRALQPVGRDVGPRVEAEFSVGPYRLRFATQWLRGVATELEILAPVREQLSGEAAQQRLDAILAETLDRPLWEALRFTQAGELGQMALTDSAVLTEALDGASGAHLHAADGAPLLERVEREFLRYYTPTGRVGGELKSAVAAATAAQDVAVHAHGRLVETEELVARHERLREQAATLAQREPGLTAQRDRARAHEAEVTAIVRAHEESTAALARARQDSVQARDDLARRERAVQDLEDVETRIRAAEAALEQVRADLEAATGTSPTLAAARDAARADRDRAREVSDVATADAEQLAAAARSTELAQVLERLAALRAEESEALAASEMTPDVGQEAVRALESAEREVLRLRTLQEATGARVTVEALGAEATVLLNGEALQIPGGGEGQEALVRGGLQLDLPGDLRVTVRPEASANQLAGELADTEARLAGLLEAAGVADVEAARAAAAQRATATARLRHVRERLADLRSGRSEADLAAELARLQEAVADHETARPPDYPLPADEATARAVARAAVTASREAQRALEEAELALAEHERHLAQLRQRLEKSAGVNETLGERLAQERGRLAESRERRSDEALQQAVAEAGAAYARVEAKAAVTGRDLEEADVDGVRARLEAAERELTEHSAELARVREQQAQVQGQVELVSGEGRQEAYDLAVAEFERVRRELDQVHRRARAARHLRDTLSRHRDAAHQAYVRPYREEIRRLGRVVYGDTFDVEVADDLTIASRTLHGTSVPFDQLSGGAKEQLGILSRLAVAGLVETGDGVPVIIDDALGYTDPERLERVSTVFGVPGEGTQVVLLTCTPERYRAIEGATTISLTA